MKRFFPLGLCLSLAVPLSGQASIAISGSLEWDKMELNASVALRLDSQGIRMPAGRAQAEEIINVEYTGLIRPYILNIPIDSSTTIEDLIHAGDFSLYGPDLIAADARRIPPFLSPDIQSLTASYTIDLTDISAQVIRHSRPMELYRPIAAVPSASYTGIIIIANEAQPIHGRNTRALPRPCLFPKIWDTDMNLIYERNSLDPRSSRKTLVQYVSDKSIFYPTPSGLSPELVALVGLNPLRIFARGVFGASPSDPIIDKADALAILSSETNRLLLREGRVAIVLHEDVLKAPLPRRRDDQDP
ncbi:MAG: polymerase [Treponema sp.]|jgi:hypothetical protein|nr:polymerase [Treponema sp.]